MRDYGKVHSTFWSSPTTAGLSPNAKMLALYLMTCTHSTIAGVFRLPDGYVAEDIGWSPGDVLEAFRELSAAGFAKRCESTKWVWVVNHLKWNKPENPNQRKAAAKMALAVPTGCAWASEFKASQSVALGLPNGSGNPSETVSTTVPKPEAGAEAGTGDSVPNGTGGEPPAEDPEDQKAKTRAELWRAGKSLLAEQGMPKGQCGSFVGKLVSDYGDDIVVEAVRAAVFAQAAEAREYLIATCQRLKGERKPAGPPLTVTSDADRKTAAYIAQQSAHAAQAVPPPPAIADLRLKLLSKGIAA